MAQSSLTKIESGRCSFPGCREGFLLSGEAGMQGTLLSGEAGMQAANPGLASYFCSNCGRGYCEKHRGYIIAEEGGMVCRICH